MPDRKKYGWSVAVYAAVVAVATVYGRYHFAADALAGFVLSFLALLALIPDRHNN
jgi:membrane-associated phospholipid phosphatase